MRSGHTPLHSPFIHPTLPPPPGSATSPPPRPGTPGVTASTRPRRASDTLPRPGALPGAECPGHAVLSTAAHHPLRKTHFKLLRASSRRLPSNALPQHPRVNTDSCLRTRVSPGRGGEPREPWLCFGQSTLLSYRNCPVPRQGAGGKGKLYLHRISQHQQSPTGVQTRLSPSKSSRQQAAATEREMLVPPRAAAEEGLRPIALSRASSARLEPRSSAGAMLSRATEAAAAAAALCRHRDGGAEPSLAPQRQCPLDALSARNAPSGRQRGTARHSQQTLRARRLVEKQGAGSLDNPLPSA